MGCPLYRRDFHVGQGRGAGPRRIPGNIYVTGASIEGYHDSYATVKYDADGNELWVARDIFFWPTSLDVDDAGNVYVTGMSSTVTCPSRSSTTRTATNCGSHGTQSTIRRIKSILLSDDRGGRFGIAVYVAGCISNFRSTSMLFLRLGVPGPESTMFTGNLDGVHPI